MAKTASEIRMDFSRAKRQADQLETLGEELKRLADHKVEDSFERIASVWEGENSEKYRTKGRILEEKLRENAGELLKAADAIRTIAQNIYLAEMRALELAQERRY